MTRFPVIPANTKDRSFIAASGTPYAKHNIISKSYGKQVGFLTEHTLFFIIQGTKKFHFDNRIVPVNEHQCILLKRGIYTISEQLSRNGRFEALMLFLPEKFLRSLFYSSPGRKANANDSFLLLRRNDLLLAFQQQYLQYFRSTMRDPEALMKLKLQEIALLFNNLPEQQRIYSFLSSCIDKSHYDIEFIVKANLSKPLTIPEFAKLCNRSLATFKRDFEKIYKSTPKVWINEQRLKMARAALRSSTKSIAEIAYDSGFESSSHFIKLFRKKYGVTPAKMRAGKTIL